MLGFWVGGGGGDFIYKECEPSVYSFSRGARKLSPWRAKVSVRQIHGKIEK